MALSDKEKALDAIAKQIKQMDKDALLVQSLQCPVYIQQARENLFGVLSAHEYSLDKNYKPIKNK